MSRRKFTCTVAWPSVRPSVCQSVRLSVSPSVRHSVHPSVSQSVSSTASQPVRPSVCPSIRLSICLSVSQSVGQSRNSMTRTVLSEISLQFQISNLPYKVFTNTSTMHSSAGLCLFQGLKRHDFVINHIHNFDENCARNRTIRRNCTFYTVWTEMLGC